ncbi:MAG: hypothetical protein DMG01_05890 [Acidobacteria bacterium]|nr:MAG: hypothetical protein DMG01_05890 [Acidobacteriota bacterium]
MSTRRTPRSSERVAGRPRAGARRLSADDAYQSWNRFSEQMPQARTICANDRSRHPLCRDHDILFVVMYVD